MRYTLEQLKAMSDGELYYTWESSTFPFDGSICGACLTQHSYSGHVHRNQDAQFSAEVVRAIGRDHVVRNGADLRPWLEQLYALRMFHDHLYPHEVLAEVRDGDSVHVTA